MFNHSVSTTDYSRYFHKLIAYHPSITVSIDYDHLSFKLRHIIKKRGRGINLTT